MYIYVYKKSPYNVRSSRKALKSGTSTYSLEWALKAVGVVMSATVQLRRLTNDGRNKIDGADVKRRQKR